jgi:hypothetical protein
MPTYEGVLKDDHIERVDDVPPQDRPVRVTVMIAQEGAEEKESDESRGERVAEVMSKLAQRRPFQAIEDPVEWQREVRRDREIRPTSEK